MKASYLSGAGDGTGAAAEAAHMAAFQADTLTEAQRLERLERWVRVVTAE